MYSHPYIVELLLILKRKPGRFFNLPGVIDLYYCYYDADFANVSVILPPAVVIIVCKNDMIDFVISGNEISTTPKITAAITNAYVDQEILPIASGIFETLPLFWNDVCNDMVCAHITYELYFIL
jgi:hypothetical protein